MGCVPTHPRIDRAISSSQNIFSVYAFERQLGHGQFGEVFVASPLGNKQVQFAVKAIHKGNLSIPINQIYTEIKILRELDHPNILKLHEVYEDDKNIYLVTEYCKGGELCAFIESHDLSENQLATLMCKIFTTVAYLHNNGIIHGDLKAQNILIGEDMSEIKLIDFGFAKYQQDKKRTPFLGTPYYVAPEQIDYQFTQKTDIWALGVILYWSFCSLFPFNGNSLDELFSNIRHQEVNFLHPKWDDCSNELQNFVQKLLNKNSQDRICLNEAMNHPWVRRYKKKHSKIISESFAQHQLSDNLKKNAISMFKNFVEQQDLNNIEEQFKSADKDNDGRISFDDLIQIDLILSGDSYQALKNKFVTKPQIKYSEFFEIAISHRKYFQKEYLQLLFQRYDCDQDGFISQNDLKESMLRQGIKTTEEDLIQWVREFDENQDGKISFEEFYTIMQL